MGKYKVFGLSSFLGHKPREVGFQVSEPGPWFRGGYITGVGLVDLHGVPKWWD